MRVCYAAVTNCRKHVTCSDSGLFRRGTFGDGSHKDALLYSEELSKLRMERFAFYA